MSELDRNHPVDFLVIGHLTIDKTPTGDRLGGTATYAALTASAFGLKVGVVTSWGNEVSFDGLANVAIVNQPSDRSTTFENIYSVNGRQQILYHVANRLEYYHIPEAWRHPSIVHLGPVAQEVEPSIVRKFPSSLIGLTPQGWLRSWDQQGRVSLGEWPEARFVLERSSAAIIGIEDLEGDEDRIEEMASYCQVFVVTEGPAGCRVFWNGDVRRFKPPVVTEVDPTGAGDIFATAFFIRLFATRDPWEAARLATNLAATSVTKRGLAGIPTEEDLNKCLAEVL